MPPLEAPAAPLQPHDPAQQPPDQPWPFRCHRTLAEVCAEAALILTARRNNGRLPSYGERTLRELVAKRIAAGIAPDGVAVAPPAPRRSR